MTDELALLGGAPTLDPPHEFEWPRLNDDHVHDVIELLTRNDIAYERKADDLERWWADRLGSGVRTLAVSSGTAALHSAYFGLDVSPGDEVLCPTATFIATALPLVQLGARPVLCDVDPRTGTIDPEDVARRVTTRTTGIVVTHLWGHPCDMGRLRQIADANGLWIVEDCAHAHGSTINGIEVGTFGDAAAFSFQTAKAVFAGQGGLLTTTRQDVYERAALLGHFQTRQSSVTSELSRYATTGFGLNYRINPLGAALAYRSSLGLDDLITSRTKLLDELSARIADIPGLRPPITLAGYTRGAQYGYKVRIEEEWAAVGFDRLDAAFAAEGLAIKRLGSRPLHRQPIFMDSEVKVSPRRSFALGPYRDGDLPESERLWASTISLPTFTYDEDAPLIDAYAEGLAKVYRNLSRLGAD